MVCLNLGIWGPRIRSKKTIHVLVVEDDASFAETLQVVFENLGCKVFTATNKTEALEIVAKENIDLVTMDINLANGDNGQDVAETIRTLGGEMPIVMASSHYVEFEGRKGLQKPFTKKAIEDYFHELFPQEESKSTLEQK